MSEEGEGERVRGRRKNDGERGRKRRTEGGRERRGSEFMFVAISHIFLERTASVVLGNSCFYLTRPKTSRNFASVISRFKSERQGPGGRRVNFRIIKKKKKNTVQKRR